MAVGGDCIEITYNHPELGSGTIFPKSAEDTTVDPGGYRTNDDANSIAGNGESIDIINRIRWMVETPPIKWGMNNENELVPVAAMAAHPLPADWTFTFINGTVWGGNGKPVGDLQGNGNAATFGLKVSGGGQLTKIV